MGPVSGPQDGARRAGGLAESLPAANRTQALASGDAAVPTCSDPPYQALDCLLESCALENSSQRGGKTVESKVKADPEP